MGWLSVLPPLLAVFLAIATRKIYLSLFLGVWMGYTILAGGDPALGLLDSLWGFINVFRDAGNTKVILFCTFIGALIALFQVSGGVKGFVDYVIARKLVSSRKSSQIMAAIVGFLIFIETSINSLIVGSLSRPLFDKYKISREKLAYICDSTSAPVNSLVLINAWGAYLFRLLTKEGLENPMDALIGTIPYNFYSLATLLLVLFIVSSGEDFGPMKKAELRASETGQLWQKGAKPLINSEISSLPIAEKAKPKMISLLLPVVVMIVSMISFLLITGNGNLAKGDGTTSVFWSVLLAIFSAVALYAINKDLTVKQSMKISFKGISTMVPVFILMTMAFAIGDMSKLLGTGNFVAELARNFVYPPMIPMILFLITAFIAFSTGTSWATYGIMFTIVVPLVISMNLPASLIIAAVIGGGVFGDHASPLSDTTIVSSMAASCDHIDHVNTQLPYAMLSGVVASLLYLMMGYLLI